MPPYPCYYSDEIRCLNAACTDYAIPCQFLSCDFGATYYVMDNGTCCAVTGEMCMPSDVRLKQGIETLKDSLETIMKLEVVEYDWNSNLNETEYSYFEKNKSLHTIGLIAQNVRQYYPEVVELGSNGYYRLDYTKLNSVLVEAIKEQQLFIDDIDKEIEYIESKLN
jgi:secreted Zn-dependent insulinase-like peptidase